MSKPPGQSVEDAIISLNRVVEADTECVLNGMDIMERVNWTATNQYIRLTEASQGLETDKQYLLDTYADIRKYCNHVEVISRQIQDLEAIALELEEWTKELEVKSRRYAK